MNLVLLLCVLALKVRSSQNDCIFLSGCSQWPFMECMGKVGLVDHVHLIRSLCSWWESFGSSLATLPPGFQLCFFFFFPHLCLWVIHWGLLLRLPWRTWVALVRASCGGAAAAWVSGVLAAPGTQGSWWPEQQEIQYSGRVWQPVLARTLQCSCLENPPA